MVRVTPRTPPRSCNANVRPVCPSAPVRPIRSVRPEGYSGMPPRALFGDDMNENVTNQWGLPTN